jgi:hypothetical protein
LTTGAKILENLASFFHRSGYSYGHFIPSERCIYNCGHIITPKFGAHSGIGTVMIVSIIGDGVAACEYDERHCHIKFPGKFEPEPFKL